MDRVLIRYGEVSLKGPGVRRRLEKLILRHLENTLKRHGVAFHQSWRERGRLFLSTPQPQKAAQAAAQVFGVVSASPVWTIPGTTLEELEQAIRSLTPQLIPRPGLRVALRPRRTKTHPYTSQDMARRLGAALLEEAKATGRPATVDLTNPDVEIHVEARYREAYIFTHTVPGPGGIPYGSQGTLIGLHSGGIDSPVAEWLMMKRGCRIIPLHLDASPPGDNRLLRRALATAQALAQWIPEEDPYMMVAPYRETLTLLSRTSHPHLTCLLCKRMMYRIAAAIAKREKAQAIVTGESLGQVASQTLTNLTILDQAAPLPVLRPLIGLDKTETEKIARHIGTYTHSAQEVGTCFALPPHPAIQGQLEEVEEAEADLETKVEDLAAQTAEQAQPIPLRPNTQKDQNPTQK